MCSVEGDRLYERCAFSVPLGTLKERKEAQRSSNRLRSRIENEGINHQKNSDLNLKHPYSMDLEKLKIYYHLLQIAHIIFQLLEKGSLLKHVAARAGKRRLENSCSLKNIARRLLDAVRYCFHPDEGSISKPQPLFRSVSPRVERALAVGRSRRASLRLRPLSRLTRPSEMAPFRFNRLGSTPLLRTPHHYGGIGQSWE